jgi:PAS domain S-box-containing protein
MRFQEQYVVTRVRVLVTQPAWVCDCGEDTYVRTIVKLCRHRTPVGRRLASRVHVPLQRVLEMRHALAYMYEQAQFRSAVTPRDQARHAISELQRSSLISILAADDTGRHIGANDAVCNLTGYSQEELLDLSIWDLLPERDVDTGRRRWQHFLRAGGFDGEYHLQRKTGELREIRCIAAANIIPGLHVATMASR